MALWDALLAAAGDSGATLSVLSGLDFGTLEIGTPRQVDEIDHRIAHLEFGEPRRELAPGDWAELLEGLASQGYQLVQSEWHHARFTPARDGEPARSVVSVVLHVTGENPERRLVLEGGLAVVWSGVRDPRGNPIPESIDATGLRLFQRDGSPAFEQILAFEVRRDGETETSQLHPILLYDLDRDGLDDVVMVSGGRVLWNLGARGFRDAQLVQHPYRLTEAALIADLDGDAHPDLLAARGRGDLVLYRGDERGRFPDEPRVVEFPEPLRGPSTLTAGDVDGDGDLDVWLGQYKSPYVGGQMPTPYYDANDGHPAYLLINDGAGGLTPGTEAAGLTEKRFRRTYASSLVDLDDDDDLDLLVVSDFAGVDLHHNDGSGHFVAANDSIHSDRHLFGMSAAFADYDLDGRLDFFVAGMASTTARRLEALGLSRSGESDGMRMRMAFGNRMYLATDSGWREPEFRADVARTGWTWGTTAFDFDNDGDPDIFAANGHQSGESTQDYCSNFWTHDIYDGDSTPNESLASFFDDVTAGLSQGKESWDGYQKNHLLMNRGGQGFTNVAFLLGVADEFDSRSAVSGDLDRDGRVDLVVVESLRGESEKLHIYRNRLGTEGHWIGVELREEGGGLSPLGAKVVVRTPDRDYVARVMAGETLMGQHSTTLHFGLGVETRVDAIEVRWTSGATQRVPAPAIDRYHRIRAREQSSPDRDPAG